MCRGEPCGSPSEHVILQAARPTAAEFAPWEPKLKRPHIQRLAAAALAVALSYPALAGEAGVVWKTPTCGCCKAWVAYMGAKGFALSAHDVSQTEIEAVQAQSGVAKAFAGCHSAKIGGYVIEGHVPAADVARLLAEKPDAIGLSVPGMPQGSPGMETNGTVEPFDVLLMRKDGTSDVFARYGSGAKF